MGTADTSILGHRGVEQTPVRWAGAILRRDDELRTRYAALRTALDRAAQADPGGVEISELHQLANYLEAAVRGLRSTLRGQAQAAAEAKEQGRR